MSRINSFLELTVKQQGSDLHVVSGLAPRVRIHGILEPIRFRELTSQEILRILSEFMTPAQRDRLERDQAVDFAYVVDGLGRFRVNVYEHLGGVAAVFRVIPSHVPTLDEAGLRLFPNSPAFDNCSAMSISSREPGGRCPLRP